MNVGDSGPELRAQLREWRQAIDRVLPPWWTRAMAVGLILVGIVIPFSARNMRIARGFAIRG